nr:ArsB/NhaD family transporter [Lebetimonas sp. JS032]
MITLIFIIWQPKGLQIGTTAIIGAFIALILGVVNFNDVIEVIKIVWDATLAFIGIIILSMVLDKLGFFEYMAIKIAKLSRGNGNLMFINSMLLGSVVSAFFANDGAALILTPILLSKLKMLKLNLKTITAFLLAGGFISDSASLPFVFSNLTNIVTADFFHIGFFEYFKNMFFPFIVSTIASTFILWLFLRKNIPNKIDIDLLPPAKSVIKDEKLFIFSFFFLALLLIGYFIGDFYHIPVSVFALGGALIFLNYIS